MDQKPTEDNVSISTLDPNESMTTVVMTPSPSSTHSSTPSPPPLPPPILKNSTILHLDAGEIMKDKDVEMYDSQPPRYHTTTTVVETTEYITNDGPAVRLEFPRLDCEYIRTIGGILKCVCMVLCFFTFLFVMMGPAFHDSIGWVTFVSSIGLFFTSVLLVLYLFRVVDTFPNINWIVIELVYCFTWTVFFFIAACICGSLAYQNTRHGTFAFAVASFFGFGAMFAYGFDCYLKFLSWKNNEKATGGPNPIVIQQQRRSTGNYV